MIENGKITNTSQFKAVAGHKPLFEFKADGVRVFCFGDGNDWVLVEGDDNKKSDDSKNRNKQCIERAQRRAELYLQAKKAGSLEARHER